MSRSEEIRANVMAVEQRIAAACARAGRRRDEVTLVAVSKTFPADDASAALAAGLVHLGENRVQEARDKKPLVSGPARWHLIGHLQSNKAKDAVRLFDVIQTVDSLDLAERLGRIAEAADKRQDVMLEVNIGREPQKAGVAPEDVEALAKKVMAIRCLAVTGLMTIPPAVDGDAVRPYFRELRKLAETLGLPQLSMGMTDDFEIAIEEGSTLVRVGRAIFGSRG